MVEYRPTEPVDHPTTVPIEQTGDDTGWKPRRSIFLKTTALTWATTVLTIVLLIVVTIPYQKASIIKGLASKSYVATTSIRDVAGGALVSQDYSTVVDACLELVINDPTIRYIVLARTDGFTLYHHQGGWRTGQASGFWMGGSSELGNGHILFSELVKEEVYHAQHAIDYSGVPWGWVSVGLSLDEYQQAVSNLYRRTTWLLLLAGLISLLASLLYARKLTTPVLELRSSVERVTQGNLSEQVELNTDDELESLARSFNTMTHALRKTHNDLVAAKDYTENVLQSMKDMLLVVGSDNKIETVNEAACTVLGYTQDELIGMDIKYVIETNTEREAVTWANGARNEQRFFRTIQNQLIPVLLSSSILKDRNGEMQGLVCVASDITERTKIETERLAREEELRTLSKALANLTLDKALHEGNLDGAFATICSTAQTASGVYRVAIWLYRDTEALCSCLQEENKMKAEPRLKLNFAEHTNFFAGLASGRTMSFDQPSFADAFDSLTSVYMTPNDITSMLVAPIRHAGCEAGFISMEQSANPFPWTSDQHHFAGSLADLASVALQARKRRTMEETLLKRDAILQAIRYAGEHVLRSPSWENGIEGVLERLAFATRTSSVLIYQNAKEVDGALVSRVKHMWSSTVEAGQNRTALPSYLVYDMQGVTRWKNQLQQGETVFGTRSNFNGTERDFLVRHNLASVILIPIMVDEVWWGIISFEETETPQEWSSAEIGSLAAAADTVGAAIRKKATQDELTHAKDRAEEANQAKSQFLANMSHEIRTPMNGLIGMLKLLRNSNIEIEHQRYVDTALSSANNLLVVMNDVLDFSQVETGRLILQEDYFRMSYFLSEIRLLFEDKCSEANLNLLMHVDEAVPDYVHGDSTRLRQVLINLVGNAIKFTEQGVITVRVLLESEDVTNYIVRIEVCDTGPGMTDAEQESLFDPFAQGDSSTTRKHGGVGLGLAISQRLIRLLGGVIRVESEIGKGSTVSFTACLGKGTPDGKPSSKLPGFICANVLLVSNDSNLIQDFRRMSKAWKFHLEHARDRNQAIAYADNKLAHTKSHDVILVDESLITLTDNVLCETLQKLSSTTSTIVLLDSQATDHDQELLRTLGYRASIRKPIRQSEVYNALYFAHQQHETCAPQPKNVPLIESRLDDSAPLVLLVEDNQVNREVATEMLLQCGIRVETVENGKEAVEALEHGTFDMVIMDCQMPEMDGYEATRVFRKREAESFENSPVENRHRLPVVALTAHAMKGDRERCLLAGMDDYMTKPLENDVLLRVLSRWLPLWTPTEQEVAREQSQSHTHEETNINVFDHNKLLARCSGKHELVNRLLRTYLEQTHADLQKLKALIPDRNADDIRDVAHRVKGSSANMVAPTLEGLAASLQQQMMDQDFSEINEACNALSRAFEDFKKFSSSMADTC